MKKIKTTRNGKGVVRMAIAGFMAHAAVAASGGNLLKNPDFEQGFAGWRESGSLWRVEDGAGYDGSKGLVWACDDATKYRYPAQYVKLEAGCAYRMSALVKVDELKGCGGPSVGFEWFDRNVGRGRVCKAC